MSFRSVHSINHNIKKLKSFQKILQNPSLQMFAKSLQKLTTLTLIWIKWVPGDLSTIFLTTNYTRKIPENSVSVYSSIHDFNWKGLNSQEIVFFVEIHGPWAFWYFFSKTGRQKYSVWVPGDPMPRCLCSVMSLS